MTSRAANWCFTLNNYTDEHEAALAELGNDRDTVVCLTYGREVAPETGTPHLQGFVRFTSRLRFAQVQEKLPGCHLSVARRVKQAYEYCQKDGDFELFGGMPENRQGERTELKAFKDAVKNGDCMTADDAREHHSSIYMQCPRFVIEYLRQHAPEVEMELHPLREWQQELYADLAKPADTRSVIFCVDTVGNTGKSWFAHYYCSIHEDAQVLLPGRKIDMAFALNPLSRVVFIDAPRSKQGEYIHYDFLEDMKNGYVFSSKYESHAKRLGRVHVVVMMNEGPDMNKLSMDRYDIRHITQG